MLFNQIVTVKRYTLDNFSQPTTEAPTPLKCAISSHNRIFSGERTKSKEHDMIIFVKHTDYAPYNNLFEGEQAKFHIVYDNRNYKLLFASKIFYPSTGAIQYYEIGLKEDKG